MRAFITGASGQDGYYLSQLLLSKGYEVFGLVRRVAGRDFSIDHVNLIPGDVTDAGSMLGIIKDISPDEIYNLAAQSHVGESFKFPAATWTTNALGCMNVLEGARQVGAKFYQASTSELFGTQDTPQNEHTPFYPRSPYGISKLAAYWATVNYREAYGLFTCNGILFNHESPIRGHDFVTQKVCRHAAAMFEGHRQKLQLGNLDASRDWGHAKDYVQAMWLMMQHEADDYVVATGKSHTVRQLCEMAYRIVGHDWQDWVETSEDYCRPADVPALRGDARKIKSIGWQPKYTFRALIEEMISHEIRNLTEGREGKATTVDIRNRHVEWRTSTPNAQPVS